VWEFNLSGASQGWLHQNLLKASDRNKAAHKINRRTVRFYYSNDAVTIDTPNLNNKRVVRDSPENTFVCGF
jgi:hypothetical protein